jgi:zinc transport system substrate-binding protein
LKKFFCRKELFSPMLKKLVICLAALFLCAPATLHAAGGKKLRVVATIYPLADMAANVGGARVLVQTLLPPGANPHTFEPRPSQVAEISRSRVFIKVGAGLDFWASKFAAAASGKDLKVVDASRDQSLISSDGERQKAPRGNRAGKQGNPHFWLDPISAMVIVDNIAKAMGEADPERAGIYLENAQKYKEKLRALDAEIRKTVAGFKVKEFVAFHSAWVYFARRYGLRLAAVIEPFPGKEPSPRYLADVVAITRNLGAKAIFAEPQLNPKAARIIAREAGTKILYLDPIGGPELPGRKSYLELMRYNLAIFKEALDG